MGWRDAPAAQPGGAPQPPAPARPYQNAPSTDDVLRGMSREQMIDYYRTSKKGDPLADQIEKILSQPMEGESPEDTERRLYGNMEDQFSTLDAAIAGWSDGAAAGGADELAGAVGGLKSWWNGDGYMPGYERSRDKAREALRVAAEEHPWAYGGGTVAGGVTQGLAIGPGAPGVRAGAAIGGAQGGLYGFLSGEGGFANRLQSGAIGGGVGAGAGALFALGAKGLGYLRGRYRDKGIDQQSLGKVADMLEDTTMTPQEAQRVAQRQGPQGMIADVNEGMQVATGGTSAAGGAGTIGPPLAARREGAKARVTKELDDAFGKYVGPQKVKDGLKAMRAPAGPAYEAAKNTVVDAESAVAKIDDMLRTYGPKSKLGARLTNYREQMIDNRGKVIEMGNVVHGIREQLDDEINALYRGGEGKMAGQLKQFRDEVDNILKTQVPGFAEADRLWAEGARIDDAYQYGKDKVLSRVHPGEVAAKVGKMTNPEEVAARAGVRDEIEMRMSQPAVNPAQRMERVLDGNMNREKVASFTTPQRADKLAQALDNETTFIETSNLAEPSRQSRTAPVGLSAQKYWGANPGTMADAIIDVAAGAGAGLAIGGPHGAMVGGAAAATSKARELISRALTSKPSQELLNATAQKLVAQGPARDKVIEDIIIRSGNKLTKEQAGRQLEQLVRVLTRGLPGPAADAYLDRREAVGGER